jgi:hypothetical protein
MKIRISGENGAFENNMDRNFFNLPGAELRQVYEVVERA